MTVPTNATSDIPVYTPPKEALPAYAPTVETFGVSLLKVEFHSPYQFSNSGSSWTPVILELNSTQLNIYRLGVSKDAQKLVTALLLLANRVSIIEEDDIDDLDAYGGMKNNSKSLRDTLNDYKLNKSVKLLPRYYDALKDNRMLFEPVGSRAQFDEFVEKNGCELLHSFTLNRLCIGSAPVSAAHTFRNCLRLRIELKQLLLQFWSFSGVADWFKDLSTGKDLATNYESRVPSKVKTIPRYSSWNNQYLENNTSDVFSDVSSDSTKSTCSLSYQEGLVSLLEKYPLVNKSCLIPINERRFVQNCMPTLNSFDRWNGLSMTLSNFDHFVEDKRLDGDVFISEQSVKKKAVKTFKGAGNCRDFLIHKEGLVSVVHV